MRHDASCDELKHLSLHNPPNCGIVFHELAPTDPQHNMHKRNLLSDSLSIGCSIWLVGCSLIVVEVLYLQLAFSQPIFSVMDVGLAALLLPTLVLSLVALCFRLLFFRKQAFEDALSSYLDEPQSWPARLAILLVPIVCAGGVGWIVDLVMASMLSWFYGLLSALMTAVLAASAMVLNRRGGRFWAGLSVAIISISVFPLVSQFMPRHAMTLLTLIWVTLSLFWVSASLSPRTQAAAGLLAVMVAVSFIGRGDYNVGSKLGPFQTYQGFAALSRVMVDFDLDGQSPIFWGGDCDDLNGDIKRGQIEVVGNGLDDNCVGGDLKAAPPIVAPLFPPPAKVQKPHNVVVITVDTLRQDYVGKHVAGRSITPNLDSLFKKSVVFEKAYAHTSYTIGSVSALWSSSPLTVSEYKGRSLGYEAFLPEVLAQSGYRTSSVVCLPLDLPWHLTHGFQDVSLSCPASKISAKATEKIKQWDRRQPEMLWVHFLDPHFEYKPHAEAEFINQSKQLTYLQKLYAQEVFYTDLHIGRVLDELEAGGWMDNTVIVFSSDHGEFLGEGGKYNHALSLHELLIKVPLAISAPEFDAKIVGTPVSHLDVSPTILDVLGREAPELWQGRSLKSGMHTGELSSTPLYFLGDYKGEYGLNAAIIDWPWKYREDAPGGLPTLSHLGDGEPEADVSAITDRLSRMLGEFQDNNLNTQWLFRRRQLLRHPREGCAWAIRVGANPDANRSLEQGYEPFRVFSCAAR